MRTPPLQTSDLDYRLPPELIAQNPLSERDQSRLLVVDRRTGTLRDDRFGSLPSLLSADDLLVLNDTKVLPARIIARRNTGGRVSGLFLKDLGHRRWDVLLTRSAKLKPGERIVLEPSSHGDALELVEHAGGGRWAVRLVSDATTQAVLDRVGRTPLPPYIRRPQRHQETEAVDRQRYQTIFAERTGAVAAPTAALHFTRATFAALEGRGVEWVFVTLHVGPGTFAPVTVESLDDHPMHPEWYELSAGVAARLKACRAGGGRVVAAGTTSVRVLETCGTAGGASTGSGWTDLFIRPPYTFCSVDVLLTNFHLPRSTLLALVMAFAGRDLTLAAYAHAVEREYRFYSYGDAMLIM